MGISIVEVIEDIKSYDGKQLVAARGRRGKIDTWYVNEYGVGPHCLKKNYIAARLDGNKINRSLPNWKLRIIEA